MGGEGMRERLSDDEVDLVLGGMSSETQCYLDSTPLPPRTLDAVRRYVAGDTLDEIGATQHVTRERVRQIINSSPWSVPQLKDARRAYVTHRTDVLTTRLREWSRANPTEPLDVAAGLFQIDEAQAAALLGRQARGHRDDKPRAYSRHSDEQILSDIRRCFADTGKVTAAAFSAWAREHNVPGSQTAAMRFGGWSAAVGAAGIRGNAKVERESRFDDDDLWAALVEVLRSNPSATARDADEALKSRRELPSFALIRQRIGLPWSQMRAEVRALLNGTSDGDPQWVNRVLAQRDWNTLRTQLDPVGVVKEAIAELGPALTMAEFSDWAKAGQRPGPATLARHFGGPWPSLVIAAGGKPSAKALSKVGKRVAHKDAVTDVMRFLQDVPGGSSSSYEKWRAARSNATSLSTVLLRCGTWAEVVRQANERMNARR